MGNLIYLNTENDKVVNLYCNYMAEITYLLSILTLSTTRVRVS